MSRNYKVFFKWLTILLVFSIKRSSKSVYSPYSVDPVSALWRWSFYPGQKGKGVRWIAEKAVRSLGMYWFILNEPMPEGGER